MTFQHIFTESLQKNNLDPLHEDMTALNGLRSETAAERDSLSKNSGHPRYDRGVHQRA